MQAPPSPGYSLIIRARYQNQVGMLGQITSIIGAVGGDIASIDIVESGGGFVTRDFTVHVRDTDHGFKCVEAVRQIPGLRILNVSDRVFLLHLGGTLEITPRTPVKTRDDLMMVYMPGVARVARAIQEERDKVFTLTIRRNLVGVVTDGSAVVGLGNIGPEAALPVMEGKAVLFKEFAGVDAFPICLNTQRPDEIAAAIKAISPIFGAIDLEGIAEPGCFEVERQVQQDLDIPVFHGSRHGTAALVLAALINTCRLTGKPLESVRVVVSGSGPAATVCAQLLLSAGIAQVVVLDLEGIVHTARPGLDSDKQWLAEHTNPENRTGDIREALRGADVFVGVTGGQRVEADDVRMMGRDPVIFALANDDSMVIPDELEGVARVVATARSDMPNQMNNVICVPGFFRGLLDARARGITTGMELAAARTIADLVDEHELHEEYIVPSVFDKRVGAAVARAVASEAEGAGLAQQPARPSQP
ncbi:MAG TPA: malic enzyme-like NAD(P)-binding protein [Armatimonadota bacterium]|nr:malic enzyme-like NAD(P)-binding protein [Armatimonadota bacterium]